MAEQPSKLLIDIYLGVFSRTEQRVLQAIFNAIAEGGGRCVATVARLARNSNTSKSTHPSGRNRPSGKDRTPSFLRCLAFQRFNLREISLSCTTADSEVSTKLQ
jgi:hypothetical protein